MWDLLRAYDVCLREWTGDGKHHSGAIIAVESLHVSLRILAVILCRPLLPRSTYRLHATHP